MASIGDWRYTNNFESEIFDDSNNLLGTATLYTEGAKVGDAAQLTGNLGVDYRITKGLNVDLGYRYVDGLYADYSINNSAFLSEDNLGALQLPSYSLVDLGITSRFNLLGNNATFRVNVNNLFDTVYIAESNTNIHADDNSTLWNDVDVRNSVWFGFGRTWNASLKYNF
jgi:outer membrane receptor for monomeric catechols